MSDAREQVTGEMLDAWAEYLPPETAGTRRASVLQRQAFFAGWLAAIQQEREECAKVADRNWGKTGAYVAKAIRARNEHKDDSDG